MTNQLLILLFSFCLLGCAKKTGESITYQDQIGDTPFDQNLDDVNFKFCDSTNVLHKRAWVKYTGGRKELEEDILKNYTFKPSYESFSGYFIIRFVVNCNNESGRFRMEVLDSDFNLTTCPKDLKSHIITLFKSLKNWNHAFYEGKSYDGYTFHNIKMLHGKIQKS